MPLESELTWVNRARRLNAIAQIGLTYSKDPYDHERYHAVREIAAEILADATDVPFETLLTLFKNESGYATPKVDVRGVVFREDKLLLVRERADGQWTLPGGWADLCHSPTENVVREIQEESGFLTVPKKLIAVLDRSKHAHVPPFPFHVYKFFIHCELVGGEKTESLETDGVEFFAENEIPPLSLDRVTPGQIEMAFRYHKNPALPALCD